MCTQSQSASSHRAVYNTTMPELPSRPALRVCSFESRRRAEMQSLLERCGAVATVVPSMQEIPLEENDAALRFAELLLAGDIDVVIFLTGVGARSLLDVVASHFDRTAFLEALHRCIVIVRGPKPVAVLREWGTRIDHRAPEPNTWRELISLIDAAAVPVTGRTVAVQEYGRPNAELYQALRERGASVLPVPVYRWALPDDTAPLEQAVAATVRGEFDVLMFTSAYQLHNVLEIAARLGVRTEWLAAANRCVIASIGPTASETLREEGLPPDVEPSHPKMGRLVVETCERGERLLQAKRR